MSVLCFLLGNPFCIELSSFGCHFGLKNAAQSFQRFMDEVTRHGDLPFVFTYIDDLLIASELNARGHHVDEHGIRPLSDKFKIIRDFPRPSQITGTGEFLSPLHSQGS